MKPFHDFTLDEIKSFIAAQNLLKPMWPDPNDKIMEDLVKYVLDRIAQDNKLGHSAWDDTKPAYTLDNLFETDYYPRMCGCMGAEAGYNSCPCEINMNMMMYKYHLMLYFKQLS